MLLHPVEAHYKLAKVPHEPPETASEERPDLFRLLVIGRKKLPDPSKHSRPYWGYVEKASRNAEDFKGFLQEGERAGCAGG